jgi:hypothetical protein
MDSSSFISGSETPIARFLSSRALLAAAIAVALLLTVLVALSLAHARPNPSDVAWRQHHEECHRLPEELYHRDRFRAIRGRITDEEGKPVHGALVRCVKLESLLALAKAGAPSPAKWAVPIEAETNTNGEGRYEFAHLPVGARTFFYSAPGRGLAQAVKDLIVVQDGLGAQLDVTLVRPASLRVRLKAPVKAAMRLHLIPHRWWPALPAAVVPQGERSVAFSDLGGPFRKGLIAASGPAESSPPRIVGRYDLDRSDEVTLDADSAAASRLDLPEAACLEPWHDPPTASERLFFAAMSPIALFWRVAADSGPPGTKASDLTPPPPLPILPRLAQPWASRRIRSCPPSSSRDRVGPGWA